MMNKFFPILLRLVVLTALVVAAMPQTAAAQAQTPVADNAVRLKFTLKGHRKSIVEIVFSPDGKIVATGSEDGTVRLWETATGRERATLKLTKRLWGLLLVWSPDSRQLATCWYRGFGRTKEVQIWDAQSGELLTTLKGHGSTVKHVEWSRDGRLLLTASDDGTAKLWDAAGASWALKQTIEYERVDVSRETSSILAAIFTRKKIAPPRNVQARFAAGGRTVVISSFGKPAQLWSADGRFLAPLITMAEYAAQSKSDFPSYSRPHISGDGRFVAITEREATQVWDARTGELRHSFDGESAHEFSPDGRTLLTASWKDTPNMGYFDFPDNVLHLRDAETGEVRKVLRGLVSGLHRIYWSPDGGRLAVNGAGKAKARLLDPAAGIVKAKLHYEGCSETLFSIDGSGCEPFAFSADGRIASKLTGALKLFDTESGRQLAVLESTHRRAAFSPTDARLLAARGKDQKSLLLFELPAR